jgi:predicted PurR-regulated permease PerM
MLETIKSASLMTKLLYLFTFLLFVVWLLPQISTYYTNVNNYQKNIQDLENISSKYGLSNKTQEFSESIFKQNTELLFSNVEIKSLSEKIYEIHITMKKEDLKSFHTFIKTISLRYYVEIKDALKFTTEEETVKVKMTVKAF